MTDKLAEVISNSRRIVFFGGAGVSTESGIPDFRSEKGLYKARQEFGYSPETLLSRSFFDKHPDKFYKYYRGNLIHTDAVPNAAHRELAALERDGKLLAVVTQNIDGLHQKAGSERVYELHGSVHKNYCMECGATYGLDVVMSSDGVPRCGCGGIIRPDVVLYGEALDDGIVSKAMGVISAADTLIIGGTSLAVYPAAALPEHFRGNCLILINIDKTPMDSSADIVIRRPIGEVFEQAGRAKRSLTGSASE